MKLTLGMYGLLALEGAWSISVLNQNYSENVSVCYFDY
jgi:hypothetical protein